MKKYGRRNYKKRKSGLKKYSFFFIVAAIISVILILLLDARLRPAIRMVAFSQSKSLATRTVNEAVEKVLLNERVNYESLVKFTTDSNGKITSITTDAVKMNILKAQVTNAVDESIASLSKRGVEIPLGTATGIDLLSGRGPDINIKLAFSGNAETSFENIFSSAGINQTNHRIMLNITAEIFVFLSGNSSIKKIETSMCIAETIIVGDVPSLITGIGSLT